MERTGNGQDIRAELAGPSGEKLVVRRLQDGDGPALQRFNAGLTERTRSVFLPHAYDDSTVAEYVERSNTGADRIYIALSGNEIVAYFFLWGIVKPNALLGIGITDAYQDRGLGTQMMQILIDDAKAIGLQGIELTTVPDNERGFHLYKKMGFQYLRDVDNVAGDGRVVRERMMFLPIAPGAKPSDHDFKPPV